MHRDIKALNVLVSPTSREVFEERGVPRGLAPLPKDPNLRVADLGVSRECSENTIMLRTMFGTPLYASPEICDGTPYDAKTDVWSLGVVLYELCALQPPFTANNLVALAKTIKAGAFEPLGDHYSSLLKEVVSMCLRVDGRARPTVQKLVQVCEDRRSGATVTLGEKAYESPPASPAKPPPKPATPPPKPVALPPTPEVAPPKWRAGGGSRLYCEGADDSTNSRVAAAGRRQRPDAARARPGEAARGRHRALRARRGGARPAAPRGRAAEARGRRRGRRRRRPPRRSRRRLADSPKLPAEFERPAGAPPGLPQRARAGGGPPLGVEAADPFLFCKERDQKARRSRKAAMFGGRPAGFADGPPSRRAAAGAAAHGAVLRRRAAAAVRPAPPSPEPAAPAAPRPARAATAGRPPPPPRPAAAVARRLAGRDAAVADAPGAAHPRPRAAPLGGVAAQLQRAVREARPHPRVARRRRPDDEREGAVERALGAA